MIHMKTIKIDELYKTRQDCYITFEEQRYPSHPPYGYLGRRNVCHIYNVENDKNYDKIHSNRPNLTTTCMPK